MHTCNSLLLCSPHKTHVTHPKPNGSLAKSVLLTALSFRERTTSRIRGAVAAPVLMTASSPSARPRGCGADGAA